MQADYFVGEFQPVTQPRQSNRHAPKADACRLASRPAALLAMLRATPRQLARTPLADLGIWNEGLTLALRRERNKSTAGHWSYDLNRHIALKRARDRVRAEIASRAGGRLRK